jgi:PadR family transcriptional regulator PadR
MGDEDAQLRKFQKELSAGTVSLVLLAVLAGPTSRCTAT